MKSWFSAAALVGSRGETPCRHPQMAKSPNAFRSSAGGELLSQTARGGSPAIEGFPLGINGYYNLSLAKQPGELFGNTEQFVFLKKYSVVWQQIILCFIDKLTAVCNCRPPLFLLFQIFYKLFQLRKSFFTQDMLHSASIFFRVLSRYSQIFHQKTP